MVIGFLLIKAVYTESLDSVKQIFALMLNQQFIHVERRLKTSHMKLQTDNFTQ